MGMFIIFQENSKKEAIMEKHNELIQLLKYERMSSNLEESLTTSSKNSFGGQSR